MVVSTGPDQIHRLERALEEKARQLAEANARFRDIIERNADAQVVIDSVGRIRFANRAAARLFARDPAALVGSPFGFPLVAGETTEVDVARSGDQRVAEMRVDATEWEGSPAFIASLRDITERRQAEHIERHLFEERAARAAAEAGAKRLGFLLNTTTLLTSSLSYTDKPALLAKLCIEQLADWAVVYGLNEKGEPCRLAVAHRDPAKAALADELRAIPIDPKGIHPIVEIMRTKQPKIARDLTAEHLSNMSANPRELEIAKRLGVASFMAVPIVARDKSLGAIAFVLASSNRAYDEEDLSLANDLARRAALAMDNALLHEQALRANQQKADFVAVISHDLRTPITAIIGYADLLELGIPEPVPQSALDRVQRMRAAASHLLYLLNELLAFARLEADPERPRLVPVDVRDVVNEVIAVVEPLAANKGLQLAVELPHSQLRVATDPDKLRQVLLNLVQNAIKYTPAGHIRVSADKHPPLGVTFAVTDTGVGIAKQHLHKVFQPFWQVKPADRTTGGGAGLGLSVVKHLVDLLGGDVCVTSEAGKGSTFTVTLPE